MSAGISMSARYRVVWLTARSLPRMEPPLDLLIIFGLRLSDVHRNGANRFVGGCPTQSCSSRHYRIDQSGGYGAAEAGA